MSIKYSAADFWRGIDRLAEKHNKTPSGLAIAAGLDPTAFNRSGRRRKNGKWHWISTRSLAAVLHATGETLSSFAALMEQPGPARPKTARSGKLPGTKVKQ
jgi:hypothetical protein